MGALRKLERDLPHGQDYRRHHWDTEKLGREQKLFRGIQPPSSSHDYHNTNFLSTLSAQAVVTWTGVCQVEYGRVHLDFENNCVYIGRTAQSFQSQIRRYTRTRCSKSAGHRSPGSRVSSKRVRRDLGTICVAELRHAPHWAGLGVASTSA